MVAKKVLATWGQLENNVLALGQFWEWAKQNYNGIKSEVAPIAYPLAQIFFEDWCKSVGGYWYSVPVRLLRAPKCNYRFGPRPATWEFKRFQRELQTVINTAAPVLNGNPRYWTAANLIKKSQGNPSHQVFAAICGLQTRFCRRDGC